MAKPDDVEKSTVIEASLNAVREGSVVMEIQKMGPWLDIHVARDNIRMGTTMVPAGRLQVAFPVDGVKEGDILTPEQLAAVITESVGAWIPACLFFVDQAHEEFGYEKPEKSTGPDDF